MATGHNPAQVLRPDQACIEIANDQTFGFVDVTGETPASHHGRNGHRTLALAAGIPTHPKALQRGMISIDRRRRSSQ